VTWINIDCLSQVDILEKLGTCYGFHPLVLEDILSDQRPKVEDYEDYIFIVLKMLYYKTENREDSISSDQVSLILGPNFVVSFKEKEADVFKPLRDRLRTGKGRIRKLGADYLAYSMMDAIVDQYFVILEKLGERFEDLEDQIVASPEPTSLSTIYNLKRDLLFLRKSVWPLREAISTLQRLDSHLISESTKIYFRDVYDHTIQVIENVETFRDMSASLLDTYLSSLSNRLNEVMKVLTVISTIFIPLTFIVGLYGMNFKYMPELESPWGYPLVIALMIVVAIVMLTYFKKRKWF
jgi:magnesium transporter